MKGFDNEYGLVNKRLPVHAVDFALPGSPSIYVETASHTLAATITDVDRMKGYSFGYLHKWTLRIFWGKIFGTSLRH